MSREYLLLFFCTVLSILFHSFLLCVFLSFYHSYFFKCKLYKASQSSLTHLCVFCKLNFSKVHHRSTDLTLYTNTVPKFNAMSSKGLVGMSTSKWFDGCLQFSALWEMLVALFSDLVKNLSILILYLRWPQLQNCMCQAIKHIDMFVLSAFEDIILLIQLICS